MTNTSPSRRISSAMASRSASRMVMVTISVPSGTSGSGSTCACGGGTVPVFGGAGARRFLCRLFRRAAARIRRLLLARRLRRCGRSLAAGLPSLSADLSSPSARIIAIGVLTATSLVPSGTRILPSVPSSTASTSIVALSVSISAMTSPDLDAVALLLQPLGEVALLHRRRQRGHEDFRSAWRVNSGGLPSDMGYRASEQRAAAASSAFHR